MIPPPPLPNLTRVLNVPWLLFSAPLVLHLFALTPLANSHHFFIYALTFSFCRSLAGYVVLREALISDGNIIFDLRPFVFVICQ